MLLLVSRLNKAQRWEKRLERKEKREQEIAVALKAQNADVLLVGEGLPDDTQVFRVKVVTTFLRAGFPLNKVEIFRDLLQEEGAYRLSSRHSLSDLTPFFKKREKAQVMDELGGHFVSIIFDATC